MTAMIELRNTDRLTVIGMDVSSPDFNGLAEFGHYVYRGLATSNRREHPQSAGLSQTLIRALDDASLSGDNLAVITLSSLHREDLPSQLKSSQIFDRSTSPNPLLAGLSLAKCWLEDGNGTAVLLVEQRSNTQVNAASILTLRSYAQNQRKRIYAAISDIVEFPVSLDYSYINAIFKASLIASGFQPEMIGLVVSSEFNHKEVFVSSKRWLPGVFDEVEEHSCALSTGEPGLLGLIKTAWCIYRQVIPGTADWVGFSVLQASQRSPFYVPSESRTWFCSKRQQRRVASSIMTAEDGSSSSVLLTEEETDFNSLQVSCRHEKLRLFPVCAESIQELEALIGCLKKEVLSTPNLASMTDNYFARFERGKNTARHTACLLGHSAEELAREVDFALKGLLVCFEEKKDWQTPLGSYYTPSPLGEAGGVAFVYPGAFNSYPGVGQDLFYLFPGLYDQMTKLTSHLDESLYERMLYPRSLAPLTTADLKECENQLMIDPIAMLISGTCLSVLYTFLLRDIFKVDADYAFGYSLGEISMLFANHIWSDTDKISAAFKASDLFQTRLAGPQNAVRSYWGIPSANGSKKQPVIWENHLLVTSADIVQQAIACEPRVYLTHINTPGQVVIGGDPDGCRRVIGSLKRHAIKAPFNYSIHNPAIASEYRTMLDLFDRPIDKSPDLTLYFAASSQPTQLDRAAIADLIATCLCNPLDFPHLVQQVYQDGARVFIELGAGSSCARWVHESLDGMPHASFSINQKGVDDFTSLLRLFARLLSHFVQIDISPLYK